MHYNLRLPDLTPVCLNEERHTQFEVHQPMHSRLNSIFNINTLPNAVTLTLDPLNLNICSVSAVMWSSASHFNVIGQHAVEVLII